jgi:hypothetical protein
MRVVHFDDEIGERELQLVRPQPPGLTFRRQAMVFAEKQQNVCRLPNQAFASLQEWWRERPTRERRLFEQSEHAFFATVDAGNVDVWRAGLLERESDEFTTALTRGPIVKLVARGGTPSRYAEIFSRTSCASMEAPR